MCPPLRQLYSEAIKALHIAVFHNFGKQSEGQALYGQNSFKDNGQSGCFPSSLCIFCGLGSGLWKSGR